MFGQISWYEHLKPEDNAKVDAIIKRIDKGDKTAFADASKLEAKVAIPFLYFQYHISFGGAGEKQETVEAAKIALKHVKGAPLYLKRLLERYFSGKSAIVDGFQIDDIWKALGTVGGMESAAVVAPYLFRGGPNYDPSKPGYDRIHEAFLSSAAFELGRMNLPDAPVTGDPMLYGDAEREKWQQWAIAHKLAGPGVNVSASPSASPSRQ